jgi:DNA-binding CsgD family transcriptional regulator
VSRNKRKKYEQAISAPFFQPQTGATLADKLKELVAGLFAPQAKTETPSADEIIEYYLTPREREVAYLAALNFTDKEIAHSLGLTIPLVQIHVRSTLKKLDLNHRGELAMYFTPRGRW